MVEGLVEGLVEGEQRALRRGAARAGRAGGGWCLPALAALAGSYSTWLDPGDRSPPEASLCLFSSAKNVLSKPPLVRNHPPPQEFIDYAAYILSLSYSSYDLTQHLDGQPLQVRRGVFPLTGRVFACALPRAPGACARPDGGYLRASIRLPGVPPPSMAGLGDRGAPGPRSVSVSCRLRLAWAPVLAPLCSWPAGDAMGLRSGVWGPFKKCHPPNSQDFGLALLASAISLDSRPPKLWPQLPLV